MESLKIAIICYAATVALADQTGPGTLPIWGDLGDDEKEGKVKEVEAALASAGMTPERAHNSWLTAQLKAGWSYSETFNAELKKDPCMLPYADLPAGQKQSISMNLAIINQLRDKPQPGMPPMRQNPLPAPAPPVAVKVPHQTRRP